MDIKRFYQVLPVLFVIVFYAGKTRAEILEDKEYQYDKVGNITGITDRINGSQGFQYDEQNRLVGASGDNYNENYEYTKTGNITGKGGKRYRYPSAGQRQPHAPTSDGVYNYTYDRKGNLKVKTKYDGERWEYFYDYESHLKKVTKNGVVLGEYLYDYAGRLVRRLEEGHETLYFNDMYEERDGVPYTFYYANGERVAERVGTGPNSKLYYYHNDHLGGTNIITDEEGKVVKKVQYFPFGKTRAESGTKDAPYKFTGKEFSSSTGLYYYGARWYDPDLGRFISPDPAFSPDLAARIDPGAGGNGNMGAYLNNPQRQNSYSYALNNPVKYVDPNGEAAIAFTGVGTTPKDVSNNVKNYFGQIAHHGVKSPFSGNIAKDIAIIGGYVNPAYGSYINKNMAPVNKMVDEFVKHQDGYANIAYVHSGSLATVLAAIPILGEANIKIDAIVSYGGYQNSPLPEGTAFISYKGYTDPVSWSQSLYNNLGDWAYTALMPLSAHSLDSYADTVSSNDVIMDLASQGLTHVGGGNYINDPNFVGPPVPAGY